VPHALGQRVTFVEGDKGALDEEECFVDATFVRAKGGVLRGSIAGAACVLFRPETCNGNLLILIGPGQSNRTDCRAKDRGLVIR
jgi:hypothetical protein